MEDHCGYVFDDVVGWRGSAVGTVALERIVSGGECGGERETEKEVDEDK